MESPGVHHTGITVSDLDRSVAFYTGLGFKELQRVEAEGEEVGQGLGVADASLRVAMLQSPNDGLLELLEYVRPEDSPAAHPNNGIGAAHICLEVADVDAAVAELRERGVKFVFEPLTHGPIRWVYAKDPDGISVELLQVL